MWGGAQKLKKKAILNYIKLFNRFIAQSCKNSQGFYNAARARYLKRFYAILEYFRRRRAILQDSRRSVNINAYLERFRAILRYFNRTPVILQDFKKFVNILTHFKRFYQILIYLTRSHRVDLQTFKRL